METPTRTIRKARVEVGPDFIIVRNRKREVLEEVQGPVEELGKSSYRIGDVTVSLMGGCGCGGTIIEEHS